MKDRLYLILYIITIVFVTSFHSFYFLGSILLVLIILSGKNIISTMKKTLKAIFFFNSLITASYILVSYIEGKDFLNYVILINLRVFDLTFLTFLVSDKINIIKALSFSKTLSFILTMSLSQIILYKRILDDFRLSLKSRTIKLVSMLDLRNRLVSITYFFLNKSIGNSKEMVLAMKSRGFFVDKCR